MSRRPKPGPEAWLRMCDDLTGIQSEPEPAAGSAPPRSQGRATIGQLLEIERRVMGYPATDPVERASRGLVLDIPDDMKKFYPKFGYIMNPKTKKPVKKLAGYQYKVLNDMKRSKYRLYLKSQKIGLTTTLLIEDFYHAITDCRGMEVLLVGQTKEKAVAHLQELRRMIRDSPVYSAYLIEDHRRVRGLMPGERSKSDILYIRNPDNPTRPTKILALGITSPGSLISFMNVQHIHMSDITMAEQLDDKADESFGGLYSRLANSEGSMVIECPPRGPTGPVWNIVKSLELKEGSLVRLDDRPTYIEESGFLVRRLTYQHGIDAKLITKMFIEREKKRLGPRFSMYYETDFYSSDNVWFRPKMIKTDDVEGAELANEVVARCRAKTGRPVYRGKKPESEVKLKEAQKELREATKEFVRRANREHADTDEYGEEG